MKALDYLEKTINIHKEHFNKQNEMLDQLGESLKKLQNLLEEVKW